MSIRDSVQNHEQLNARLGQQVQTLTSMIIQLGAPSPKDDRIEDSSMTGAGALLPRMRQNVTDQAIWQDRLQIVIAMLEDTMGQDRIAQAQGIPTNKPYLGDTMPSTASYKDAYPTTAGYKEQY